MTTYLLDQVVQVLWELWGEALGLEDPEDLRAGQGVDVGDTLGVTKPDACTKTGGKRKETKEKKEKKMRQNK